ncbi:hypothetical protein CGCS363_v012021 [Colletotrichum siamense]|uniref:uncharacterized protein n=1 Tax=Colletotrichum siamense TaxID=690259 RepID=UPI0018729A02|nr:uncharacterized protein CGCS363_v012021 [Colletotrichum siamense]KAF5489364.1 hypothetical protein CGCS363_v012021 [Colletotrichum siamense]
MPEASVDPGYGSLRRKVTLACDYCRKKRISSFSGGEYLPSSPNVASSIKIVATNDLDDEDPDSEEDVFPPATEWRGGLVSVLMDASTPDSLYVSVMPSATLQEQGLRSSAETHLVGKR